ATNLKLLAGFSVDLITSQLALEIAYDSMALREEQIQAIGGYYGRILEAMASDPLGRYDTRSYLTPAEEEELLVGWNEREEYGEVKSLAEEFEKQVERRGEAIAVSFGEEEVSYGELNERANQVGHYLREKGVGRETLVGVCMERSAELVVVLLGILKAGGAYVPLDPRYPRERLGFMVKDAGVGVLVTESQYAELVGQEGVAVVSVDLERATISAQSRENLKLGVSGEQLAYVIYTSGSSGEPKGMMITHGNVGRLFAATAEQFDFSEQDVWTLFHSYGFDFSVWEMWGALLHGGRVVVVPYWVSRSPEGMLELLRQERVSVLNQTPSAFRQLQEAEAAGGEGAELALRAVIFGGEALELPSLSGWFERHGEERPQLVNMYGIPETTVRVTYRRLGAADAEAGGGSVIGRGIGDLQVYVLDEQLQPVPVGVAGEMYIGGAGVGRGYLNRLGLTAARFVPHLYSDRGGERLYRSGDLARYLPDGDLEYLGRIDQQVKIRGHRIELGEI